MYNLTYERNNVIKILNNEIKGINQLIDILEELQKFDFTPFNNKIINVKLENALNENSKGYIRIKKGYDNEQLIYIMIKDRYNIDTKSYIGYYVDTDVKINTIITYSPSNKEQYRLDATGTIKNIDDKIEQLVENLIKLENELLQVDDIIKEVEKLNELVYEFKEGKSSFLLNQFKSIRNYY